jgi:uncharacterized membrane protein YdjX (TVP38/TMEM64 family)
MSRPARNRRWVVGGLIAGVALLAAIGLGLEVSGVAGRDAEAWLRGVAEQRPIHLGLGVFAVFLIGSLLFIPLTVLIIATEVVLGPRVGALYAYGATLGTSLVVFWGVRRLGGTWMRRRLEGRWPVLARAPTGPSGVLFILLLRAVPAAPFVVGDAVLGSSRTPFSVYWVGSAGGLALYVLAVTGLVITGRALWLSWGPGLALAGATVVLGLGVFVYRQRLLHRSGSRRPDSVA